MNYKEFFKDKRIAVISLGPHGEMIPDIKFLINNKALVSLFNMRSEKRLKGYASKIKDIGIEKIFYGDIKPSEILDYDLIIISSEISKKSFFLKEAIFKGIQIEYLETLFFKLAPSIVLIGVMGMYGKSTVSQLIYTILKSSFQDYKDQGLFFIDSDSNNGILVHLKKIKKGDVVLLKILTSLLPYYYEIRMSPHVAVVVSTLPFNLLEFQTYNNYIVANDNVIDEIKNQNGFITKAKLLRTRGSNIPIDWQIPIRSKHDLDNMALVLQTCELFKVTTDLIRDILYKNKGKKGSMELVKKVSSIEYYNDTNSVTPISTLSAISSLAHERNIILIWGGAYTGYDYGILIESLKDYVFLNILLPGSGSISIRSSIDSIPEIDFIQAPSLEDAVIIANKKTKANTRVVFSPGFDAIGIDISRKDRGERFVKAVKNL